MNVYPGAWVYALSLFAVACFTGGIAFYAFRRSNHSGATALGGILTSITLWILFYAGELLAPTLSEKLTFGKLEYIGITSIPVLWFLFALEYTGHKSWLNPIRRLGLCILPAVTLGLSLTNELHALIWAEMSLDPQGFPPLVILEYGRWFWVHVIVSYSFVLAGVILYLTAYFQAAPPFQQQMKVVVWGSIIPLGINAIRLFTPVALHGLDLTPFTFAFSGALLFIGFFRFNLIDLVPIATSLVIENLHDAVIVIDNSKRVVAMNPTARRWLKVGPEAIGQNALDVIQPSDFIRQYWDALEARVELEIVEGERPAWLDATIAPLRNSRGTILGRVVVAQDKTREKVLLLSEKRQAQQMELLNSITRATLEMTTFQGILQTLADRMGEFFAADGTFITLWDDTAQKPIPGAAYGVFRDLYPRMKFDSKEVTMSESVLQAGHPLPVEDVFHTPYMSARIATQFPSRSLLALPLIAHGQKLGAALISFNQPRHFTPDEIAIGEQVAAQISLALNKAQLLENVSRRVTQMGLIQEVSQRMAESLDEVEICQKTVDRLVAAFGYNEAIISILVEDNKLEVIASSGAQDPRFRPGYQQDLGQGIIGHVADTRQSYYTGNVSHDPYYLPSGNRDTGASMAIPLSWEKKLIGVLYVQSTPPHPIAPDDQQILETIANYLVTAIQKARFYADINESLINITALQSVTQTINSSLELGSIFKTVVDLLKESYGYRYVSIYLLEGSILRLGAQVGYPQQTIFPEISITTGIMGRSIRTQQPQFVRDVSADPDFLMVAREVTSEICIPLLKEKNVLGALNIESNVSRKLSERDVNLLTAFANPIALAIDNARLHARVTSLAFTDGMTGLVNRRAFDQTLELEITRAGRYEHPLALIMLDIDSFKRYNDTYGHPAGDERIKAIARLLLDNVRDPDIAARYGGEEFVVILPHTTKEGAIRLAERLRETAEMQASEKSEGGVPIPGYTLSLGVAVFPEDGLTSAELLLAADNAEMEAKRLGKNRVCAA